MSKEEMKVDALPNEDEIQGKPKSFPVMQQVMCQASPETKFMRFCSAVAAGGPDFDPVVGPTWCVG
jgi:hypothetical protein